MPAKGQRAETCLNGHERTPENVGKRGNCLVCRRERQRERQQDSEYRARQQRYRRTSRSRERERAKTDPTVAARLRARLDRANERKRVQYATDSAYRALVNDKQRERYRNDPEFRERVKQQQRKRYRSDPEFRESVRAAAAHHYRTKGFERRRARARERWANDPELRRRRTEYLREYRARIKETEPARYAEMLANQRIAKEAARRAKGVPRRNWTPAVMARRGVEASHAGRRYPTAPLMRWLQERYTADEIVVLFARARIPARRLYALRHEHTAVALVTIDAVLCAAGRQDALNELYPVAE